MENMSEIDLLFQQCMDHSNNKHKKYSIEYKLKVLKLIDLGVSLHKINENLGIDRKTLRDWKDKKNQSLEIKNKDKRFRCKRTTGLTTFFPEDDEIIIKNWIISCRKKYVPVSTKSLVCYAGNINPTFKAKSLKVQLRWSYRFLRRHGFSIRRIFHVGQFVPRDSSQLKTKFINEIIDARKNNYIDYLENEKVINMDETPCYLDMNMDTTIDFQGSKNIEIINSGRNNYRISIILEFQEMATNFHL